MCNITIWRNNIIFINSYIVPTINTFCFVSKSDCVISLPPPLDDIVLSTIVILVPAINTFCFASKSDCNEDKPLSIFTPFIIALLPIIEPLAKILPATSNFSVAAVDAPILNPLSLMLCKGISLILNSIAETPLKPVECL